MVASLGKSQESEEGQSLVLIVVFVMIGALIAFAIAARTIQDIRRTGQERVSDQAGTQVETYLDAISSGAELEKLFDENMNFDWTQCSPGSTSEVCLLDSDKLYSMFGELVCDDAEIKLRKDQNSVTTNIHKDDALQVNIDPETGEGSFTISWSGTASHLIIKVYALNPDKSEIYLFENDSSSPSSPVALSNPDSTDPSWGVKSATAEIPYPAGALFARIHAIGGSAEVSVTGIPSQQITAKASCSLSGIYREFVRVIQTNNALPVVFDYALYDRDSAINEF